MKERFQKTIMVLILFFLVIQNISCEITSYENVNDMTKDNVTASIESEKNSTVSIGEVKNVNYSGYKDYFYADAEDRTYLFDTSGKIIKQYLYNNCPTKFFEGIAMKEKVDTAHNKRYYIITDYNGNDITSKFVSSTDRFFEIYNIDNEPLIAAIVFEENAVASVGKVSLKDREGDSKYIFSTEDNVFKENNIDVTYLKDTDTKLSYVNDKMMYLSNKYKKSYFINLDTKEVFEDKFGSHGNYIDGYISYNGNAGCGIVDKHGNNILNVNKVPKLQCLYSKGVYFNCTDKKFYNINGECVIDLSQYNIDNPYNYSGSYDGKVTGYVFDEYGFCKITVINPSGKKYYGLIDITGKWVIELQDKEFTYCKAVGENMILMQIGTYYKVYDLKNKKYIGEDIDFKNRDTAQNFCNNKLVYVDEGKLKIYDYGLEKGNEINLYK